MPGASVSLIPVALIVLWFLSGIRIVNEYEQGVVLRLGRFAGRPHRRAQVDHPVHRPDDHHRHADHRGAGAAAGRDHARQRLGEGERGHLLPRDAGGPRLPAGDRLPLRDEPVRADDAPLRARPGGPRRPPQPARQDQPAAPGDHRPAHRAVGREGDGGRGEAGGSPRGDAARHGQAGGGRARAPLQDHRGRGRVPGRGEAREGGGRHRPLARARSSSATSRRSSRSPPRRTRPSSSRCRSSS